MCALVIKRDEIRAMSTDTSIYALMSLEDFVVHSILNTLSANCRTTFAFLVRKGNSCILLDLAGEVIVIRCGVQSTEMVFRSEQH